MTMNTDKEKLKNLVTRFGYWSLEVQEFNEVLKLKGGIEYMYKLNNPYVGTANAKRKS